MTYVMWRQEHLWKISVLQRGHIFSLVIVFIICVFAIVFFLAPCEVRSKVYIGH